MQRVYWAAVPLAFMVGCVASSLTRTAHAAPAPEPTTCISREEVEALRARIIALEQRLQVHAATIRVFQQSLGVPHECE